MRISLGRDVMGFAMSLRAVVVSLTRVIFGAFRFLKDGRTPDSAYQGMIRLFCLTGGRSNDVMSKFISALHPPYPMHDTSGILGELTGAEVSEVTNDIDHKGYHVFRQRVPDAVCDELVKFAVTSRCVQSAFGSHPSVEVPCYPRANAAAVRYEFKEQDVVNNASVQRVMADASLVAIAQSYLRCKPVLDFVSLWWSTDFSNVPDKDAAQFWHFDMDRIKWLKFFIYLTDVGPDNGPHSFVAGSHRSGGIPDSLLTKGYARLTDAEVENIYSGDRLIEFTAPRGTVIVEDTRGLHKGRNLFSGDRLMLQLQFSNSQFGSTYPSTRVLAITDPKLKTMESRYPRLYTSYPRQ